MAFKLTYRPLFELKIYHRYLLDDGETPFDQTPEIQEQQLEKYNFKTFLKVQPSQETQKKLKGHRILFKTTPDTIILFVLSEQVSSDPDVFRPLIAIDDNLQFDFMLRITDSLFSNYSAINAVNEIPYFFSNYKPILEAPGYTLINTLTDMIPARDYTISGLTFDDLKTAYSPQDLKGVFGIVSLKAKGENQSHNLTLVTGNLPQSLPQFKIIFENRKTFWRYYRSGSVTPEYTTEPDLKPLVKNGMVSISDGEKDYPAATPKSLFFERDSGGNIIKTFSEIYI